MSWILLHDEAVATGDIAAHLAIRSSQNPSHKLTS